MMHASPITYLQRLLTHFQLAEHALKSLLAPLHVAGLHHVGDVSC